MAKKIIFFDEDKIVLRSARSRFHQGNPAEIGQATVEYVLILAVVVGLVVSFTRQFLKPWSEKMVNKIKKDIEEQFTKDEAFHSLKIRR